MVLKLCMKNTVYTKHHHRSLASDAQKKVIVIRRDVSLVEITIK